MCVCVCVCVRACVRARARLCVSMCARALAKVCFDCVLVLCFVMGYMLQFGEIADKIVHYYYCYALPCSPTWWPFSGLAWNIICGVLIG